MIVFVVGTGTDVGKTHVTTALMKAAAGAAAWKPIATGMTDAMGEDARAIGATEPPLYAFEPPISPHLAARRVGVVIRARAVAERARELAAGAALFFVESAGGLFSPISETETNFDIAKLIDAPLLLVAPDRIGVLHDITATVRAAGIQPVVALSAPATADASTGTNAGEISRLGLAKAVIEFPRAAPAESLEPARACLRALADR
jgi:dethiobiotin synthetase